LPLDVAAGIKVLEMWMVLRTILQTKRWRGETEKVTKPRHRRGSGRSRRRRSSCSSGVKPLRKRQQGAELEEG